MRNYFFTLVLFLTIHNVFAQFEKGYASCAWQDTIPPSIYNDLERRLESFKSSVEASSAKERSFVHSLYQKRFDFVVGQFNDDYFITDCDMTTYLQGVLNTIYDANPSLPREATVYVHRSFVPNAVSFGDGTIGFTLGLLSRMDNEALIAFVLCHELAHYHTGHSTKSIHDLTRLNFDKELQKKIKDIRSSEYNRYSRYKDLVKGLGLEINRHSREHEFEADSLGLVYYANTNYNLLGATRTIEVLDSVDINKYTANVDFKRFFNFKEYAFKDSWLEYTKSNMWYSTMDETGEDTTKTHPSCQRRLVALNRQLTRGSKKVPGTLLSDARALSISTKSDFELVESAYHFKAYGQCLFTALLLADHYPNNAYLHAMIGRSLYQLYAHQKNHELGKVLQLPDPRFDENYDRFLTFIHTLRLNELASLSYYYMINGQKEFFENEDYLYSLWLCSDLDMSKLDRNKVKEDYQERFPKGRFLNDMTK